MNNKIDIEDILKEKYNNIEIPEGMFNINYAKLEKRKKATIIVSITLSLLLVFNILLAISQSIMFIQMNSILSKIGF